MRIITMLRYTLLMLALASAPGPAMVQAQQLEPAPGLALPGADHHTFRVGDVDVTSLPDGTFPQDLHVLLRNASNAKISVEASINAFLFRIPGHVVLVDTGPRDFSKWTVTT